MEQEIIPQIRAAVDDFRCPTCGARQELADACRRCKCDLSLVVALHRRRHTLRWQCLLRLRRQQTHAALQAARELHSLAPDEDSLRLLAVAHLLCGEYARAVQASSTTTQ